MVARAVALLDVLLDACGLGLGLCLLTYLTGGHGALSQEERWALVDLGFLGVSYTIPSKIGVTLIILYLIYMMTELLFAILLMVGISLKSSTLCDLWLTFALLNFTVKAFQFLYIMTVARQSLASVLSFFAEPLLRAAMFYVIQGHTHRLKRDEWDRCGAQRHRGKHVKLVLIRDRV